jgi:hypothetical protein
MATTMAGMACLFPNSDHTKAAMDPIDVQQQQHQHNWLQAEQLYRRTRLSQRNLNCFEWAP